MVREGIGEGIGVVKFYMSIGLGRRNDVLHSTMGLDGTGEISAFSSLVSFRLLGYFEQSITEIEIPPLRKIRTGYEDFLSITRVVCLLIRFLFCWLGSVCWVEGEVYAAFVGASVLSRVSKVTFRIGPRVTSRPSFHAITSFVPLIANR